MREAAACLPAFPIASCAIRYTIARISGDGSSVSSSVTSHVQPA